MLLHFRDILVVVLEIALGVIVAGMVGDASVAGSRDERVLAWAAVAFVLLVGTLIILAVFLIGRPRRT